MSASVDKDLESKMLNLFRRMSVCAAHHQEKDSEWIDGQCVTPSTATKEAVKLIEDHDKALKQELEQQFLDDVIQAMEAAPELRRAYADYDGDMDWVEFVNTYYFKELQRNE